MNKYLYALLFSFAFFFCSRSGFAAHLVGGDITVAYAGSPNNFNVTVKLYRDNSSTTQFETTIYVGVYDRVTHALQTTVTLSNPTLTVLSLGNGCYTPSLSIQRAVYVTNNVIIADNANGYYLSYNRCCRNGVIANIVTPSDDGFVAYCEIPNPTLHDNSPVFNVNPDGYMCRGYLNTDAGFSATDADGDVLVYSFATPLSCSANGQCDNFFNVNPGAVAGPYGTITWGAGYSLANPMGDPAMAINSATGSITTTPPNLGIYIFCVKVEEWRGGVKIGEIRRDFQFDVLSGCSVLTLGSTPANPVCLGTTVTLSPAGASSGFTYSWNPGGATTSVLTITPGSTGTYNYTVTATNGSCTSSATAGVIVSASPSPTVVASGNPCTGQTMTLTASGGTTYSWSNGYTTSAMSTTTAGTYTVGATTSGCTGTSTGVIYAPITASTYTWTGSGSTAANNWFDPLNWSAGSGCIPTCSKDVWIPAAASWANPANNPDIGTASGAAACRSITLLSGAKLAFSSATSELDICGDFTDNGVTLTYGGNGLLKFIGTVPQNFSKSGGGSSFHNVTLANTATVPSLTIKEGTGYKDLSLDNSGVFTFTSGYVVTEGSRALEIKNTAAGAVTGYGANSYVYGRLRRYVANSTSYDFPVGGNPSGATVYPYELMNIAFGAGALAGGLSNLTVCFDNPANTTGITTGNGLPLTESSGQYTDVIDNGGTNTNSGYPGPYAGIWTVIPDAGGATYDMTLAGKNFDNATLTGTYYSILKRNTFSMCTPVPVWTLDGVLSTSTNSITGNIVYAKRTGLSNFSQFAITKHTTPLPVTLMAFDASCMDQTAVLSWATASELNNDYFTLERSCNENMLQYETIAKIKGAGTSNTMHQYSYTDKESTSGNCFYRLVQTDFNGATVEYAPVSINCKENSGFNFIGTLPNPAADEVNVLFSSDGVKPVFLRMTDMLGQELFTEDLTSEIGLNVVKLDLRNFAGGVYAISLDNGAKLFTKKIVKKD